MRIRILAIVLLLALALPAVAQEHWVATWAASPQSATFNFPMPRNAPPRADAPPAQAPRAETSAPRPAAQGNAPSPFAMPPGLTNQTVRMIVNTSIGGNRVRVSLSNAYGAGPLSIGAAHIALHAKDSAIVPESDRALTFSGKPAFVIPPGALVVSDPVELKAPKEGDLVVSLFVAGEPTTPTIHLTGLHTTYVSNQPGDFTKAVEIADAKTYQSWYWISSVDVLAPVSAGAVVAFGDSITDGATSTPDANRSWPAQLALRLAANAKTAQVAVVNEGISGNRVLADGAGVSALARFDRDVLTEAGAKWLIVLEGINDIGMSTMMGGTVSADELIAAHKQLIERAHMHGIKAIGATLLPYGGATYYTEKGEAIRQALNQWIRTSGAYDAVVDFDAKLRDPHDPSQLNPAYYLSDHLHPNDAGYKLMAEAVDLTLFQAR